MALVSRFLSILCFLAISGSLHATERKPPNVIVILADELGYGDVGFNGSKEIPTPNIDRIAAGGVVATNVYAPSLTSAANRAGLLTGRYPSRFGYETSTAWRPKDPTIGLPAAELTLAEALRPRGYQSGLVGKWHLGAHLNFHPMRRGFDSFLGYLGGGHSSFPVQYDIAFTHEAQNEIDSYHTWIQRGLDPVQSTRHLTEELSAEALDFVRGQANRPFFLLLSYNAPRQPLQVDEKDLVAFRHIKNEKRRSYAAMIALMDRGVGQLLDLLDLLELGDDTVLVFTSSGAGDTVQTGAYNGWSRGTRGECFEGGVRLPFVIRWPRVLPAGTSYGNAASLLDVFATVAAASGIPARPDHPLDGVDLVPFLRGENLAAPHPRRFLRNQGNGVQMVREGDFKLIKVADKLLALYNVKTDPTEKHNIAEDHPELVRALYQSFETWNAQLPEKILPGIGPNEWTRTAR